MMHTKSIDLSWNISMPIDSSMVISMVLCITFITCTSMHYSTLRGKWKYCLLFQIHFLLVLCCSVCRLPIHFGPPCLWDPFEVYSSVDKLLVLDILATFKDNISTTIAWCGEHYGDWYIWCPCSTTFDIYYGKLIFMCSLVDDWVSYYG